MKLTTPLEKLPYFPRRGWLHHGCDDRGTPDNRCQYCGKNHVRYMHILSHADWPDKIETGCVCAGKLGLEEEAISGERKARSKALRLEHFLKNGWLPEKPGMYRPGYIKRYKRNRVLVRPRGWGYVFQINYDEFSDTVESLHLAKVGAFEELEKRAA